MITKIELFLKIWDYWKSSNPAGQTIEPQIEVRKGPKGDIPVDVKMILRTDNGGPDFLGQQMQVSMNSVQGHDYPYFYCVLVAKHEFHLLDRLALWEKSKTQTRREVITEGDREAEVDIIVIRQQTSRSGGYHTKYPQAVIIFEFARALMLELLKINR
jgi:hypothetical protein